MSAPLLLDLFCKAGGAAAGYARAGWRVVGVDHETQPRYPFEFVQADALAYVSDQGHRFDAIHASPPCQAYTVLRSRCPGKEYPDLVAATRDALRATGLPYVIENVPGAPLVNPVTLCGAMFPGLRVYRHRLFESNRLLAVPAHPRHVARCVPEKGKARRAPNAGEFVTVCGDVGVRYAGPAMGIDWMTGDELSQAIPPAYTEHIGRQLAAHLIQSRAA